MSIWSSAGEVGEMTGRSAVCVCGARRSTDAELAPFVDGAEGEILFDIREISSATLAGCQMRLRKAVPKSAPSQRLKNDVSHIV